MLEGIKRFRPYVSAISLVAFVGLMWLVTIPAREQERNTTRTTVWGTVQSVRVATGTSVTEARQGGDPAVTGAVIGGLLVGPTGAVIGSAMGSGQRVTPREDSIVRGCALKVNIPGRTLTSVHLPDSVDSPESRSGVVRCTLVRPGDRLIVSLATYQGRTNYTVNLP